MRYKAKTKDCRLTVTAKTSLGEEIDVKALDAFSRIFLRGFLKPKVIKKNVVEYSGPVGISLYERLRKPMSKRDFLFIMEQIVVAVQKIHSNNLSMNKLVLDTRYVFINDVTKEIQLLYVPSSRDVENPGVVAFMESIVYSIIPATENDSEFVSRFIYFLKGLKVFKPELVEQYIEKEDRSVVNTIKKQNAGQSGFMTSKQKHYYEHYDSKSDDDDPTGLLEQGDEATGILAEGDDATSYLSEDDNATSLLIEEDEAGTALLDESQSVHYPTLLRVLTEETISINKPVFRLGKERSYVDYFVTNNNAVSRSHADIISRGNKYFVIDLNSKNHTYINNQLIAVQCETEIRDGDRLKLGNEEFIFQATQNHPATICRRCGKTLKPNSNFCIYCGSPVER